MGQLIKITHIPGTEPIIVDTPAPEPTNEERIAALEDEQAVLADELVATKILLGLEE